MMQAHDTDIPIPEIARLFCFDYEAQTAHWSYRPFSDFSNAAIAKAWNARWGGEEAFTSDNGKGYRTTALTHPAIRRDLDGGLPGSHHHPIPHNPPRALWKVGGPMSLTIELKLNGKLIGGAIVTNQSGLADISDYRVEAVETASPATGRDKDFRAEFLILDHARKQTVWALVQEVAAKARKLRLLGQYDQEPRDRGETL